MSSHTTAFTFLPGSSSVSWAVRDWVSAKVKWAIAFTRSFYNRLPKPLLMWCRTLFLLYFVFVWKATKGEIWFPVWHGGKPSQTRNTRWNFEWETNLHCTDLFYILGLFFFFFLQQLLLPSLTYLFYGEHHTPILLQLHLEQHSYFSKATSYKTFHQLTKTGMGELESIWTKVQGICKERFCGSVEKEERNWIRCLWLLILCVNLIGLRGDHKAGSTISGCVYECFWKRLAFNLVDWIKKIPISNGWSIIHCVEALTEEKSRWRLSLFTCLCRDIKLLSSGTVVPQPLNNQDFHHWLPSS